MILAMFYLFIAFVGWDIFWIKGLADFTGADRLFIGIGVIISVIADFGITRNIIEANKDK